MKAVMDSYDDPEKCVTDIMLEQMKTLLCSQGSCVLATTDGERPHCSLMAYVAGDTGESLFLVTPRGTKKYRNLKRHPYISLLIDTRSKHKGGKIHALTVAGCCDILQQVDDIARVKARFLHKNSHLKDFLLRGDTRVVRVQIESFLLLTGPENAHYVSLVSRPSGRRNT